MNPRRYMLIPSAPWADAFSKVALVLIADRAINLLVLGSG